MVSSSEDCWTHFLSAVLEAADNLEVEPRKNNLGCEWLD